MKTKTKKILAVAAIVVISYTVGKCRGIIKLGKEVDKELKKKTDLEIGKVCYDIGTNKVAVDLVNKEEKSEKE